MNKLTWFLQFVVFFFGISVCLNAQVFSPYQEEVLNGAESFTDSLITRFVEQPEVLTGVYILVPNEGLFVKAPVSPGVHSITFDSNTNMLRLDNGTPEPVVEDDEFIIKDEYNHRLKVYIPNLDELPGQSTSEDIFIDYDDADKAADLLSNFLAAKLQIQYVRNNPSEYRFYSAEIWNMYVGYLTVLNFDSIQNIGNNAGTAPEDLYGVKDFQNFVSAISAINDLTSSILSIPGLIITGLSNIDLVASLMNEVPLLVFEEFNLPKSTKDFITDYFTTLVTTVGTNVRNYKEMLNGVDVHCNGELGSLTLTPYGHYLYGDTDPTVNVSGVTIKHFFNLHVFDDNSITGYTSPLPSTECWQVQPPIPDRLNLFTFIIGAPNYNSDNGTLFAVNNAHVKITFFDEYGHTIAERFLTSYETNVPHNDLITSFRRIDLAAYIPQELISAGGKMYVELYEDNQRTDSETLIGSYYFSLETGNVPPPATTPHPSISITSPNGGQSWVKNKLYDISWSSQNYDGLYEVDLTKGGETQVDIADNYSGTSITGWTVPDNLPEGDDYKIRVKAEDDPLIDDSSDEPFSIIESAEGHDVSLKNVEFNRTQVGYDDVLYITDGFIKNEGVYDEDDLTLSLQLFSPDGTLVDEAESFTGTLQQGNAPPISSLVGSNFQVSTPSGPNAPYNVNYYLKLSADIGGDEDPTDNEINRNVWVGEDFQQMVYEVNDYLPINDGETGSTFGYSIHLIESADKGAALEVYSDSYNSGSKFYQKHIFKSFNNDDFVFRIDLSIDNEVSNFSCFKLRQKKFFDKNFISGYQGETVVAMVDYDALKQNYDNINIVEFIDDDYTITQGWIDKIETGDPPYESKVYFNIPRNASPGNHELWLELNGDYYAKLQINVKELSSITLTKLLPIEDTTFLIGDSIYIAAVIRNNSGLNIPQLPVQITVHGQNYYSNKTHYLDLSSNATDSVKIALSANQALYGQDTVEVSALLPEDSNQNDNTASTVFGVYYPPPLVLQASLSKDSITVAEPTEITASVKDTNQVVVGDATVSVTINGPDGFETQDTLKFANNIYSLNTMLPQVGDYSLLISAEHDRYVDDRDTLILTVYNTPPAFPTLADTSIAEDDTLMLSLAMSNLEHDNLWFSGNSDTNAVRVTFDDTVCTILPSKDWYGTAAIELLSADYEYSDTSRFQLQVLPVNDPPRIASPDSVIAIEDSLFRYIVEAYDVEDDSLTYDIQNLPSWLKVSTDTIYGLAGNGTVDTSFVIVLSDTTDADTALVKVHIQHVNDPPVLSELPTLTLPEDSLLGFPLSSWGDHIEDVDNTFPDFQWSFADTNGVMIDTTADSISVQGKPNWFGQDTALVTVSDGELQDTTLWIIHITPVNDPPHFIKAPELIWNEDSTLVFPQAQWAKYVVDVDTPPEQLAYQFSTPETITIASSDDTLRFTPPANWFGTDSMQVIVSDTAASDTSRFLLHVTPVNDPPVLSDIPDTSLAEDGQLTIPLADWDGLVTDVDNPFEDLQWGFENQQGLEVDTADGAVIVQGSPDWYGRDTIEVHVSDGTDEGIAPWVIQVTPVNDPPVFSDLPDTSMAEDSTLVIPLREWLDYLTDVDNDFGALQWSYTPAETLTVNLTEDGVLHFSPPANWSGVDSIGIIGSDGQYSDTTTLVVTVYPVNDAPAPFDLLAPATSRNIEITNAEYDQALAFRWGRAKDPDQDKVYYRLQISDSLYFPVTSLVSDTVLRVPYHEIIDSMETKGVTAMSGEWTVLATDTVDTNAARNGPFHLSLINTTDFEPPGFLPGLLQNPITDKYLDLYLIATEQLEATPEVLLNKKAIEMKSAPKIGGNVWHAVLHLVQEGNYTLAVSGEDPNGNASQENFTFSLTNLKRSLARKVGMKSQPVSLEFPQKDLIAGGRVYVMPFPLKKNLNQLSDMNPNIHALPEQLEPRALFQVTSTVRFQEPYVLETAGNNVTMESGFYRSTAGGWGRIQTYTDERKTRLWAYASEQGVYGLFNGAEAPKVVSSTMSLEQNYPNPFSETTTIEYTVPVEKSIQAQKVRLIVYNLQGEIVKDLVNRPQMPESYTIHWNGMNANGSLVSSGVYFLSLAIGDQVKTKKMIFVK